MNGILKYLVGDEVLKIISFTHFTISYSMHKIFLYRSDNLKGNVIQFKKLNMDITERGFVTISVNN